MDEQVKEAIRECMERILNELKDKMSPDDLVDLESYITIACLESYDRGQDEAHAGF